MNESENDKLLKYTTEISSAYLSNNEAKSSDIPALIKLVYDTMANLANSDGNKHVSTKPPAVEISKSITDGYIVCLEDGAKLKMLKRYLRTRYDLSPEEYRLKWGLPANYPMVAPAYARKRSAYAKKLGLGKK